MKPIIYHIKRFRPEIEATSKEIDLLSNLFNGKFTILDASFLGKIRNSEKRGIYLLLDIDSYSTEAQIKFLLREGEFPFLKDKIKNRIFESIVIENKISANMNELYRSTNCTSIPYHRQFDEYLKLISASAAENLAAGKPVLVSSKTGIAEIIKPNDRGVVFEPTKEGLLLTISELKKNYGYYQKNCWKTAEKYFSKEQFFEKHRQIYAEMERV